MRIAVVGSGGLGGYFGARLADGGSDVHFLARGAHLDAMRDKGIAIEGGPDPIHVPNVDATDDPAQIGPVDLALIAVKLWDTESVLEQIRPLVGSETVLVSCQNGVLKDIYMKAAYPERQIMGGVAYVATTIDRPGVYDRRDRCSGSSSANFTADAPSAPNVSFRLASAAASPSKCRKI